MSAPLHEGHLPWRGDDYGARAERILLLGDSHYLTGEDQDYPGLTCDIVRSIRDGKRSLPIYSKVASLVGGPASAAATGRTAFWDGIAFFNYVPVVVGRSSSAVPTPLMWDHAIPRFFRLLAELLPSHVLSLGQRQWNAIRFPVGWSSTRATGCDENIRRWLDPDGRAVTATWINHPSSRGFAVAKWRERVRAWLTCRVA